MLQNYKPFETLAEGATESVIITCPSCQTRFNLDAAKLQPVGRHVRCAKCSHRWLQMPEGMERPGAFMPPAADEPATPAPEPTAAAPVPESPPAPEPAPTESVTAAPPAAAEEAAARPPETPAEVAQSLAAIAEQVAAAGDTGGGSGGDSGATGDQPVPKLDPPSGRLRLGNRATGPITVPPLMRPARPARRNSGMGLLLTAGVVIGLLAAAYFFRDEIARTVPGADAIYSLLGLSTDNPAADLEISIEPPVMQEADGKRLLSVTATVFNLSDYPVDVPPLMMVPVDENGNEMEPILFRLRERVAEPGQNIKFQKSFDNWPTAAKSFVLRTADAP
ncbi:MAG TPA: DUF3426 domain-containing protein [Dongiaceae bacterium]|nr:DUF3426 domain-containing protein [Dongiaceae bacterium]